VGDGVSEPQDLRVRVRLENKPVEATPIEHFALSFDAKYTTCGLRNTKKVCAIWFLGEWFGTPVRRCRKCWPGAVESLRATLARVPEETVGP
jgi:UDP-3-O-acyl-N-acetylglucosamine deacetylase